MGIEAFRPELAVERLNEGIVGRRAGARKVEHDILLISPKIKVARNEFGTLIDPDRPRIADALADPLQRQDHVFAAIAETRIDPRREPREGVDNRQNPDLASRGQLVVNKVHRPGLIVALRLATVLAQLGFHPLLRRLVAQLQAKVLVKPVDALDVHRPALPRQKHVDAPVAIAHPRLRDLLDPLVQLGLAVAFRLVDTQRPIDP